MLLAIGIVVVFASCIMGFMMAGGNPASLIHAGEIMIIVGIGVGIVIVSSPKSVLMGLVGDISKAFKGGAATTPSENPGETNRADQKEKQVGRHVECVWQSEKPSLICELVVRRILRNGCLYEDDRADGNRY